jgi:hypothetical protein
MQYFFLHSVYTGFGAHLASYPVGTRALSPGGEAVPPLPNKSLWRGT